ncbi:phosphatidylinositol-4-phosphate 5-kinase fab1 [Ophiocordyceps camponoti-floridani]|uniref:1-phosphatidylinositol-3-phosphate 5-kinase n=1 Tax=Ophiocordyceps camponoti-floridani TaxID=2030778 RepID=A0A8H4QDE5_9HYPO|nr:phosphatidylinositol-4-phosphate 5-kinase fab1 [Ophiocordyceps camponoti-floridani]
MSSTATSKALRDPSPPLVSHHSSASARASADSMSTSSAVDKEQLAHALDKIHITASRCDSLTTFNDFAPPPERTFTSEGRGSAGDLMQHGLSGLYSRFREVVGGGTGGSPTRSTPKDTDADDDADAVSSRQQGHSTKPSVSSLSRNDTVNTATNSLSMSQPTPMTEPSTSSITAATSDMSRSQTSQASKPTSMSLMSTQKLLSTSARQSLPTKATSAVVAGPTIAPPVPREASLGTVRTDDGQGPGRRSIGRPDLHTQLSTADSSSLASGFDANDAGKLPPRAAREDSSSVEGSVDSPLSPPKTAAVPNVLAAQRRHVRSLSNSSSMLSPDGMRRKPVVIDRISRPRSPGNVGSRESSLDRGTAEVSPVTMSAFNSGSHGSFGHHAVPHRLRPVRFPGIAAGRERASNRMAAQLDRMRRQVLSKEFWMKDDTVKECFLCQTPFTAFRRKHHCRTCGCIFDSKCTTVVPGHKFGVQGSLRVCKNCLDVISRRFDGSGSDDSGDERSFMPRIFGPNHPKHPSGSSPGNKVKETQDLALASEGSEDSRTMATPMMAIPATRRVRGESNRSSAVLEIDAPQLSRPGSSRSLRSLNSGRPQSSAGHKRHHSKHGFLGRFKAPPPTPPFLPTSMQSPAASDDRAPFRKGIDDDNVKKSKLPAFHDDNIIDPDLADYMSDDSSGDEQLSIFATMGTSSLQSGSYEIEKSGFAPFINAARKHRHRNGEKSISGISFVSRGVFDDFSGPANLISHRRTARRRNLSNVSGSVHHFGSPRPKSAIYKGASASTEMLLSLDNPGQSGSPMTGNESFRNLQPSLPKQELNRSSLRHVDKLLRQLLTDARISSPAAWQRALVPILLQLTDDVTPDVAKGEDMDIRHYVKLKRIPGGKPSGTTYVSGVVFTKNLALKSMPRRIMNPRIVLVTFAIEYQRHQQHFMSLQPVIEQEKEYLRVVVQRITNLRPHVLLAQKSVSGVALQYLSEANISVAYNVKDTVIEAVARCAEAEIIESLDMLALPVRVGRCSTFEVRTFVNNDHPGRKKSYIFLSGCRADLGCTIALRGADSKTLGRLKQIMEFMVYVVYNLKLETSLLRDECIQPPDAGEASMSSSVQALNDSTRSLSSTSITEPARTDVAVVVNQPSSESELPSQTTVDSLGPGGGGVSGGLDEADASSQAKPVSLHEQHSHASHDGQVPDDVPMPTFYSDMVAKYETKILSASPYVKFKQPYLLMRAREQERRLLYLRRLRDQDLLDLDSDKAGRQKFQLIKPEMVEKIGQKAPRQVMEVLHAVHDAEYDKALFNYQTQTRQWETYIQGNLDLFDPYSHQNIVVLYSVICSETKIPCIEPSLVAINFYDEHVDTGMDPDCTLGQYIEDLAYGKEDVCNSNGCEKMMLEHHRTYVHDQYRITVFVERMQTSGPRRPELGDGITMWTYCKLCKKDSTEKAMSDATFKYSFGKYLELLYWGRGLRIKSIAGCPHDHYSEHVRYFCLGDSRIRIHWDPIDLLEIVVPRARITWKVVNDLRLKNEIFTKMEERWSKFMASVRARLKSIRIDSVLPEKAVCCKAEVERLMKRAQEEQPAMVRQMQSIYAKSKYYEVVPFNSLVREMLEKAGEWDQVFAKFEADFLGDKDMRQLTIMQLRKMFTDNESKESLVSTEANGSTVDGDERPSQTLSEADEKSTQLSDQTMADSGLAARCRDDGSIDEKAMAEEDGKARVPVESFMERVEPLDLAASPLSVKSPQQPATQQKTFFTDESTPHSPTSGQVSPVPPQAVPAPSSPLTSPSRLCRSPTDASFFGSSLTEKMDQMRHDQPAPAPPLRTSTTSVGAPSLIPKPTPDRTGRPSGSNVSPPMIRASSHPARATPRSQSLVAMKTPGVRDTKSAVSQLDPHAEQPLPEAPIKVDKKLSDRLGLSGLKHRSKGTSSSIPRLVHKKRESKVSTLARHFEQLSREFERERIRDRKQRAASFRQPKARLPRTSTKAIVHVYDDVNQAFEEPAVVTEPVTDGPGEQKPAGAASSIKPEPPTSVGPPTEAITEPPPPMVEIKAERRLGEDAKEENQRAPSPPPAAEGSGGEGQVQQEINQASSPPTAPAPPVAEENDDVSNANTSQAVSEDEGGVSDPETAVADDFLPGIKELADALEPSSEIPLELPKHQKTSLMKYLTNFWAERSASGWSPLEYPVNSTDHIFVDSDIIVREDEPSSVIALALNSEDYKEKLVNLRREAQGVLMHREGDSTGEAVSSTRPASEGTDMMVDETEQEKSLLRATGTHLKYQFKEGAAVMTCKIFYAEQFDALRRKCGVAERIVESLSRCLKWDSRGGKTKSVFLKTLDDRLVLKSLSPVETSAFLRFAPGYFSIMAEALFHDLPSVIAKMLGFFQVIIKNPTTGTDTKLDLLITENLFYDRSPSRIFDLKGSMRNRRIQSTGEQNEVLLDENMVEYIYESPLFAREHSKKLLRASVWNDTLFLARQNVMDYSLMIAVDEERKELVVGIIDCIRTYTWDKKLESWIKDRGFAGGGRNRPTVTSPKEYKSRFREAMARYILQAPNCWHLFNGLHYPSNHGRARFEDPEALSL